MAAKYWQGTAPAACDVCGAQIVDTFSDAKTPMGPWANLCPGCASSMSVRYGLGFGQKYEKQSDGRWLKTAG